MHLLLANNYDLRCYLIFSLKKLYPNVISNIFQTPKLLTYQESSKKKLSSKVYNPLCINRLTTLRLSKPSRLRQALQLRSGLKAYSYRAWVYSRRNLREYGRQGRLGKLPSVRRSEISATQDQPERFDMNFFPCIACPPEPVRRKVNVFALAKMYRTKDSLLPNLHKLRLGKRLSTHG
jgi:hypothetical protein